VLAAAGVIAAATVSSRVFAGDWEPPFHVSNGSNEDGGDIHLSADGTILLAWNVGSAIRFCRFSRTFEQLIDPVYIATGTNPLFCEDPAGNLHFLWTDSLGNSNYRLLDPNGMPLRPSFPLSDGPSERDATDLTLGGDGFAYIANCKLLGDEIFVRYADNGGTLFAPVSVALPAGPHAIRFPRIFPLEDGTVRLFYVDFFDNPNALSRVYTLRMTTAGDVIEGPTRVSHEVIRTYDDLTVVRDAAGDFHLVFHEVVGGAPPVDPFGRLHYRRLAPDGTSRGPVGLLASEPLGLVHSRLQLALDDRGRLHLFSCRDAREESRKWITGSKTISDYVIDPANPAIADARVVVKTNWTVRPVFRADGRGGWFGSYGEFSHLWMIRTNRASECRNGAVGGATAFDRRTLSIAGSGGDASHVLRVPGGVDLPLAIDGDAITPTTRFYVQARAGAAGPASPRWFPGVGLACFDFLDHASAAAIWNGLGGAYGILGRSRLRATPIPDPVPHPGVFYVIPGAATSGLPPGTRVAFQGFQTDTHAPSGASVTNAIVLEIQ